MMIGVVLSQSLVTDIACVVVCSVAVVTDLRFARIPNWLTFGGLGLGLTASFVLVWSGAGTGGLWAGLSQGLLPSFVGALFLLVCFGAMAAIGAMGMGDVKLMGAVGAFLGWPLALWTLVYVLLAGGVLSIIYALVRGQLGAVLTNIARGFGQLFRRKRGRSNIVLHRAPYALAILAGAIWAVLTRYYPLLRLP